MQIDRKRGDTKPITATVTFSKDRRAAVITGCTFRLTVDSRLAPTDETTKLFHMDGAITDADNGVVEFYPTEEQAGNVGYFYYDIEMIDTYAKKHTLICDAYVVTQDITK